MKLGILLFAILVVMVIVWVTLFADDLIENDPHTKKSQDIKYLDKKYLYHVKMAQKTSRENKAVAEFHMAEMNRYKEYLDKYTNTINNMPELERE